MKKQIGTLAFLGCWCAVQAAIAQPPGGSGGGQGRSLSKQQDVDDLVSRMMAFDANKDGHLIRSEVTDTRLHRLFDRADANQDGTVTKSELTALGQKEHANIRGGPGFGPPGGPGGFGPPGGFGFGPPRPGEILPPMLQDRLRLTAEQKSQLAALQKEVDARLEKILTAEQRKQLDQMRRRGPGGFGPPGGGPGGPGGFGPPGGRRRPEGPGGGPPPDGSPPNGAASSS